MELTHLDASGRPRMVDVGEKPETARVAEAAGELITSARTVDILLRGEVPKGHPLVVAQLAGIQAAKRTAELIPLCHQLPLTKVDVELEIDPALPGVRVKSVAKVTARTGVEMEALTAVSVALLTMYDMLKAVDSAMRIDNVRLTLKTGGSRRSGETTT
jgi:cyclic pyranopterin monophosphate synthase